MIINLLVPINSDEIVLPAIQRDFVWSQDRIEKLMDSIMRGYPTGIILLRETYNNIQHRRFEKDYLPETLHSFHDNNKHKRLKLVLDGQQRSQSLYTALYGSYDGTHFYFDILSGRETEDFRADKFIFRFFTAVEAAAWNKDTVERYTSAEEEDKENLDKAYYVRGHELFTYGVKAQQKFRRVISKMLCLSETDELRLETNLATLNHVLTKDGNILKTSILDESKPRESTERKSESDVLEAFVRINREGIPLSRSDLIFSMLQLNWRASAAPFPQFIHSVNEGTSFDLVSVFVLRCLFAVSALGSKFDVDLLRKRTSVAKIKARFQQCCAAIRSTVAFVQNECWIASSKLIGGYYNLLPPVYYLFHAHDHQVPLSQPDTVRKAVYILAFTSPFSRYADSRLGKFIRDVLRPLAARRRYFSPC